MPASSAGATIAPTAIHLALGVVLGASVSDLDANVLRCLPVSPTRCVVVKPIINVEEHVDRVVGRRTGIRDPLSVTAGGRADAVAWQRAFGGLRVSRGVYRFHTHEEADEWLWKLMAHPTPT